MTRRIPLVVLVLAAVGLAAADDKKDVPEALKPFQGKWKVVKGERKGKPLPPEEAKNVFFVFEGDKLTIAEKNGKSKSEGSTVSVDAGKRPAEINFTREKSKRTLRGIYKFEGGKLTLCYTDSNNAEKRPKEFATRDGDRALLVVLEKAND